MKNTFDEVAEKIEEENKLEKLLEIKSEKELYDFFKENGYSKSESEFKADIEKLIAESSIDLKNSDLSEVAGGAIKNNLTKLASAGMASLLALGASPISSKAYASDAYHFTEFQPTSIQKSSQKGGSKAKKIILGTIAGIAGLDAAAIGVMSCVGYGEGRANMENKIEMLKNELDEMSETAKSYGTDLSSKIEKCIDNLKDIEDTCLLNVKERKFETLEEMVEGVKKDFQDAKDKRAQEEKQVKAKAEAEQQAKEEEKRKLEEPLKVQKQAEKEETERQKALEREKKQKQDQIKKLNESIQELKESLNLCLGMNLKSGAIYNGSFGSYARSKIEVLEGLKNISDFEGRSKQFESVKGDAEEQIRNFINNMVTIAETTLNKGNEAVENAEKMLRSIHQGNNLSQVKVRLEINLKKLEDSLLEMKDGKISLKLRIYTCDSMRAHIASVKMDIFNVGNIGSLRVGRLW